MYPSSRTTRSFSPFGGGGPVPPDVVALFAALFVTFSLQFFATTAGLLEIVRLTPLAWQRFWVWQLASYPFVGIGQPLGFLLELLFLFQFVRDVRYRLGRAGFWRLLVVPSVAAGAVALAAQGLLAGTYFGAPLPFVILQGQHVIFSIVVAAWATMNRGSAIYLFFVLPIQATWLIPVEILFAFVAFLGTHDFPGFLGLVTAIVAARVVLLGSRGLGWRETRRRLERWWLERRLERMRRRSGMRVVRGPGKDPKGPGGPWVH